MSGSPAEGLLFLPFFMGEGEQTMAKIDEVRQCAMAARYEDWRDNRGDQEDWADPSE